MNNIYDSLLAFVMSKAISSRQTSVGFCVVGTHYEIYFKKNAIDIILDNNSYVVTSQVNDLTINSSLRITDIYDNSVRKENDRDMLFHISKLLG